jgi:hypothetical protein
VLTNASILERLYLEMLSNANIVNVTLLDMLTTADIDPYSHREVVTSASIIGTENLPVLTSASISEMIALALATNASIVTTALISMLTGASIIGPSTTQIISNASISGPVIKAMLTNACAASRIVLELTTWAHICEYAMQELETNANIASFFAAITPTNADILDLRYWALGPEGNVIDLSGMVYLPQAQGFGLKTSKQRLQSTRRVNLLDDGLEGGERRFTVAFTSDQERQAFQEAINNNTEDLSLHVGRSDRYHRVKKASVEPGQDDLWKGIATLDISCLLEDPYLYHAIDQGVNLGACPLPQSGVSKYNYGNVDSPILFKIGGFYSGGLQLANPTVSDGTRSLSLGPGLLSREFAELTLDGALKFYLTHTYEDDFETNNYWQYDAVQSGCSLAGSQVSVPSGCWFYYKFQGLPLKENIRLVAKITKTGSPLIQYSTDGATWYTAVAASEIVSGVLKEYWLTGTEKLSTVYVRFYSPSGSSMQIQDIVQFQLLRDISAQHDQMPTIAAGETGSMAVTGSGSTKARIQAIFRARWHPT